MTKMYFKFDEPEHGWMHVTVGNSEKELNFDISDVPCNSIESLAVALLKLQEGAIKEEIKFSLEPEFALWVFEVFDDELELSVFPDSRRDKPVIFKGEKKKIMHRLYKSLRDLESLSFWKNPNAFESKWSWVFPSCELNEFKANQIIA